MRYIPRTAAAPCHPPPPRCTGPARRARCACAACAARATTPRSTPPLPPAPQGLSPPSQHPPQPLSPPTLQPALGRPPAGRAPQPLCCQRPRPAGPAGPAAAARRLLLLLLLGRERSGHPSRTAAPAAVRPGLLPPHPPPLQRQSTGSRCRVTAHAAGCSAAAQAAGASVTAHAAGAVPQHTQQAAVSQHGQQAAVAAGTEHCRGTVCCKRAQLVQPRCQQLLSRRAGKHGRSMAHMICFHHPP